MTGHVHRTRRRASAMGIRCAAAVLSAFALAIGGIGPSGSLAADPAAEPPRPTETAIVPAPSGPPEPSSGGAGEMFRSPDVDGRVRSPRGPTVIGPAGFHETSIFSGLTQPTAFAFAADGKVYVAEKAGIVKVFDSINDPTPTIFADLRKPVYNVWDRGLLGIALDPTGASDDVWVLYTYNHILGDDPSAVPRWVDASGNDTCPKPPGISTDGCVASARLSRLRPAANGLWDGIEHVLVEAWCQVQPSHSIGTVAFGTDGALYAGSGDSANFNNPDWGQDFNPLDDTTPDNPCGDPPSPVGTELAPPTAEGGALRAQDLRTSGDPAGLSGSIIRVDPQSGDAMPDNANAASADPNVRRIVGYGLRNPFRFTFRPGTDELWLGDVGWNVWEEIDRILSPTAAPKDFGWPCYEGPDVRTEYANAGLAICDDLYATPGATTGAVYTYRHNNHVVGGDACPSGTINGSVISGLAFYPDSGPFPASFRGTLFFADYARDCIWAMAAGSNGLPDATKISVFASGLHGPVDLKVGPDGALYYAGLDDGAIHRFAVGPRAVASAQPASGPAPLAVQFNGSASSDPKGGPLTYAWDLDNDGQFDDSTAANPSWTYPIAGTTIARLRVTDSAGTPDVATATISVGNGIPSAHISAPSTSLTWSVGDTINVAGSASDPEDGTEPGGRLTWTIVIHHCPAACHDHTYLTFTGSSGSFPAPDHDVPSDIQIDLVAIDASGASSARVSVTVRPKTDNLSFVSIPAGVALTVGGTTTVAPFVRTAIDGSAVQVSAPASAIIGGRTYGFVGWSDGQPPSHTITASQSSPTLTATYGLRTTFVAIAPIRVIDTRTGQGGPLAANTIRSFQVAGIPGIPAAAIAVTGNLTAVRPSRGGYIGLVHIIPSVPTTSALNLPAGDIRANGVTSRLSATGMLGVSFRAPSGSTDLILDVTGYFVASESGTTFTAVGPTRVLDTRTGAGGVGGPLMSGAPRMLQLRGVAGVPSDATAVTGSLVVTGQTAAGYVAMTTAATSTPSVSTINVPVGDTRANGLTVKLDASGRAALVYIGGTLGVSRTQVIFDVTGYFRPTSTGLHFYPTEPTRIFDSRNADGPALRHGAPRPIDVVGAAGLPAGTGAAVITATIVGQTAAGFVALTPTATSSPTTSNLNFPLNDIRATNTVLRLDGSGHASAVYMAVGGATTNLVIDLVGIYR